MEDDEQVPFSIVDLAKIMEDTCGEIPVLFYFACFMNKFARL